MMLPPIVPISPIPALEPITPTGLESPLRLGGAQKADSDFSEFLRDALGQVDALQKKSDVARIELATGQVQDLSEVMIALEKSGLALSIAVATRDKVIDAYNQVMRMQL